MDVVSARDIAQLPAFIRRPMDVPSAPADVLQARGAVKRGLFLRCSPFGLQLESLFAKLLHQIVFLGAGRKAFAQALNEGLLARSFARVAQTFEQGR